MEASRSLLIGSTWRTAADGAELPTIDPATGRVFATVAAAAPADVDEAVAVARAAYADGRWRDLPPAERAQLLWRIAELIDAQADELATLESLDQGQPVAAARNGNIGMAAEVFRYYAGWCTKATGSTIPVSHPETLYYTRREPLGVCALITPWNFPFAIAAWKLAPALACGNVAILKPAEQTPMTTLRLAQLCLDAGIPAGVVSCLTGGPEVGKALAAHPDVDKVSFTGSTAVGRHIVAAASGNLKRVSLELGGKAPSIIAPDADLDRAVEGNLRGALANSGQVCAAYTRFYVHSARVAEFTEKLATAASRVRVGPGDRPGVEMGPLVSREHLDRVGGFVEAGRREGAELVTGGERLGGDLTDGYFLAPTVFGGVRDDMLIAQEEIFGPVLSVLSYEDVDELVDRANGTEYGLAASIWTQDLVTAHRMAAAVRAGGVYVNMLPLLDPAAPWGGFGASGWGRELGAEGLAEFSETKGIWINLSQNGELS